MSTPAPVSGSGDGSGPEIWVSGFWSGDVRLEKSDCAVVFTSPDILSVVVVVISVLALETLLSSGSEVLSGLELRLRFSSVSVAGITVSVPQIRLAIGLVVTFLHILLGGLGEECLRTTI